MEKSPQLSMMGVGSRGISHRLLDFPKPYDFPLPAVYVVWTVVSNYLSQLNEVVAVGANTTLTQTSPRRFSLLVGRRIGDSNALFQLILFRRTARLPVSTRLVRTLPSSRRAETGIRYCRSPPLDGHRRTRPGTECRPQHSPLSLRQPPGALRLRTCTQGAARFPTAKSPAPGRPGEKNPREKTRPGPDGLGRAHRRSQHKPP